ncbi:tyrosine-type recombinase/integrase [Micromonospora echinofusca]|uniref:Tyrosine-type recombinase/integrase n=1 Tax=Micromonospora echinofusca TaxID=47858 RepID=A0ABS3VMM0_MICEH|nr:tyrosine-type recombinase/integrase [Micromonospora echinofusca]
MMAGIHRPGGPTVDAAGHEGDLSFTTRYGTPIEPRNFQRFWQTICNRAGVRPITVHDARRTCATLLADLDVHPRVAMQILRHARFPVTMKIYTQVSAKATRAAPKRLGESLTRWRTAVFRCCTGSRKATFINGRWPLTCVGDTGIEPVTSSV